MLPVLFVAHGSPMLAVDTVGGAELTRWAATFARPSAILIVSAHWEAEQPALGSTHPVPLMYDFSGFPDALYRIQYPCPGAADLARRVEACLSGANWGPVPRTDRALDHGAWVPLLHLYPQADVPVLQMALPSRHSLRMLMALGAAIAPLRGEGVLIVASGVLVHNFSFLRPGAAPEAWAIGFEDWLADKLTSWDLDSLVNYKTLAPGGTLAAPTPEHLVPLYIAVGAAGPAPPVVTFPIRGFEMGSLSRTCIQFV